jgi:hypothetical protein
MVNGGNTSTNLRFAIFTPLFALVGMGQKRKVLTPAQVQAG